MIRLRKLTLISILFVLLGCNEEIIHNLSEPQANKLLTGLHSAQIEATKVRQPDGQWALSVRGQDTIAAIKYLDDSRVFRSEKRTSKERGGLISSREDERFEHERSMSSSIEQTLFAIRGVLDARVHLNLPVRDPLFGKQVDSLAKGTGSVLLIVDSSYATEEEGVRGIVSGASGVDFDAIAVLINESKSRKNLVNETKPLQSDLYSAAPTSFLGITFDEALSSHYAQYAEISAMALLCLVVGLFLVTLRIKRSRNLQSIRGMLGE